MSLVLSDRMVSGQHLAIAPAPDEGTFEITDLSSTNGTVVDGEAVESTMRLRDGAIIFVGSHVMVFRVATELQLAAIQDEMGEPLGPVPTVNPAFALICRRLRKLAEAGQEFLLTGETGAGKEIYANAIHRVSGRKGPFIPVNCAALPRELVESELFGYARGAHSQAAMAKPGIIEQAEGGTLFLDEIGEMAPELQTKLLRFTQDRMLSPIGGVRARHIDTRIIAATSRTTGLTESGSGGLRADLAARLGAEPIRIPPLRDRIEDLGALGVVPDGQQGQAVRPGGVPVDVPLRVAGERARAGQGRHERGGAGGRRGTDRLRPPAGRARVGAAPAFVTGAAQVPQAAQRRGAGIADEAVPGEHDARRARAGSQAGAGLPVGAAIWPAGCGIPAQRGRGERRRRQRGSGRRRGRKLSRWAVPAGCGPTMWGRSHTQIHGYETETMKIGLATRHLPRCDASACDPDHRTAEVRRR